MKCMHASRRRKQRLHTACLGWQPSPAGGGAAQEAQRRARAPRAVAPAARPPARPAYATPRSGAPRPVAAARVAA